MPAEVQLSAETIACLRDEAYARLCRDALTDEVQQAETAKQRIAATRPAFGVLASKQTRETYETSLKSAVHTEKEMREKLTQVGQLEQWLQSKIQRSLHDYLTLVSGHYQGLNHVTSLVVRWERALVDLSEHVLAFARELRSAAAPKSTRNEALHAIAALRSTTGNLHIETAKVSLIASEVSRLSEGLLAPDFRLPAVPGFRPTVWVDRLLVLSPADCSLELNAAEADARNFCAAGRQSFSAAAEQLRLAADHARQVYLTDYWQQLRHHALQHYVAPREVDEVLADLTAHYVTAELQERQAALSSDPFSMAR